MIHRMIGRLVRFGFESASLVGRNIFPHLYPEQLGLEVIKNVAYNKTGLNEHKLDIYRPKEQSKKLPIVFYIHGGGFRILSKDTHWYMAQSFAVKDYIVFNVNYRLAPKNPFPAGLKDCAEALLWVLANAEHFGGDTDRLIITGESAGANLSVALNLLCFRFYDFEWAEALYKKKPKIKAVIAACGVHEVSRVERFASQMPPLHYRQMQNMSRGYLPAGIATFGSELADPLRELESGPVFENKLPPHFVFVGSRDELRDDSVRLHKALLRNETHSEFKEYARMPHAFHAIFWLKEAAECWRDQHAFLDRILSQTEVV